MRRKKFPRSTNVGSISTNTRKATVTVWFRSGGRYRYYYSEPQQLQEDLQAVLEADEQVASVGRVFNATVKRHATSYQCLKPAPPKERSVKEGRR